MSAFITSMPEDFWNGTDLPGSSSDYAGNDPAHSNVTPNGAFSVGVVGMIGGSVPDAAPAPPSPWIQLSDDSRNGRIFYGAGKCNSRRGCCPERREYPRDDVEHGAALCRADMDVLGASGVSTYTVCA